MLAKKEGKKQPWVSKRMLFGRFLNFIPTGINSETVPNNLTCDRFRSLWEQTDKDERNDRIRFQQVLKLIREDTRIGKPPNPKGYPARDQKGKRIRGAVPVILGLPSSEPGCDKDRCGLRPAHQSRRDDVPQHEPPREPQPCPVRRIEGCSGGGSLLADGWNG
jgi:hypothetical protein